MTCLALEWSSPRLSVAVKQEGTVLENHRQVERFQLPVALELLSKTLKDAGADPEELTEIRVGRGPGNYTGVRQAIAVATGLALPGKVRLSAATSGWALFSGSVMQKRPGWILGDARRGAWWGCRFPSESPEWKLRSPEAWGETCAGQPVYSAEADRLKGLSITPAFPEASALISLGEECLCEPVHPLYLHPAV